MKSALADRNCREAQWPRSQMKPALTLMTISTLTLLLGCSLVLALDPSLEVSQYAHTARTIRDGFSPGNIYAMAQTPDGYIWLGSEVGLLRFDDVPSIVWQASAGQDLPGKNIDGLTNQASFRAGRKTRAELSLRDFPNRDAQAGHAGGERRQIYPPHHKRWPVSRLCYCHFAGPPGLHVVCHPRRPQSL